MISAIRKGTQKSEAGSRSLRASFWRRQLRQWHWISSALCLALVFLFAVTGFTLNHAASLEAEGVSTQAEFDLPATLVADLSAIEGEAELTAAQARAIQDATGVDLSGRVARNEYGEMIFDLARPGKDASLILDLNAAMAYSDQIDRGTIAKLNDLHKGRHAGAVWSLMIDFAAACFVVFAVTGFGLLWLQARMQPATWPLATLGAVLPLIAYILFVHA
ncbi:PepSY-associated TM helix domain-containing protein [Aurantiacibacter flavus]|uniref:PepSY-associated TM helix domain-containing protein n=1 Tax=Aurantiacibacter flavus TaxID=3145232 RepID=A0ABV0CYQ0_9SPHN